MRTLNSRGFGHVLGLGLLVLGVGVFGTYQLVASSAKSPSLKLVAAQSAAPAPKNTEACKRDSNAGSTYFYDGTRCVTLIKPVCQVGAALVSSGGIKNVTYFCQPGKETKSAKTSPKPKASLTVVSGARKDGVNLGFIPQVSVQVGDVLEFSTTVTNTGPVDIKNVFVSTTGVKPNGLSAIPGSLLLDGKAAKNSLLTHATIGLLPVKGTHTISFKATVGATTFSRCGEHKYKINNMVIGSAIAAQRNTITLEVCP